MDKKKQILLIFQSCVNLLGLRLILNETPGNTEIIKQMASAAARAYNI